MDIDGYDGTQLAPLDNAEIDNSLTANVNQMFDISDNNIVKEDNIENMESSQTTTSTTDTSSTPTTTTTEINKGAIGAFVGIGIFLIIWMIIGIIAFITSLFCFGFSGSTIEKIIGLILAIFFGPLYFIYFYLNKNYCGRKSANNYSKSE